MGARTSHAGEGIAASMLFGVALSRYVLSTGPVSEMPFEDLVAALAPSVQAQLAASQSSTRHQPRTTEQRETMSTPRCVVVDQFGHRADPFYHSVER